MEGLVTTMITGRSQSRFLPSADFWRGKRVFLTGHTGFKGTWLTLWLSELGAQVFGYALAPDPGPNSFCALGVSELCDSVLADVRNRETLTDVMTRFAPEIVVHMAAQPLVRRSYRDPVETFDVNVIGTLNVLEVCRRLPSVRAVVVVTTDKCYENRSWLWPYREDEPLGGHDPYSASKACAEIVVQAYRRSYFSSTASPVGVASARAGNVFGGGDWSEDRLVPDAVRAFVAKSPLIVRNSAAVRPWQHVAAPLTGYLMLAQALYEGGAQFATAFNFGPGGEHMLSVQDVVERLVATWDDGAGWVDRSDPAAPHEASILMLDSTRARATLGWRPPNDISKSIRATVVWYKAYYQGSNVTAMRQLTLKQIRQSVEHD